MKLSGHGKRRQLTISQLLMLTALLGIGLSVLGIWRRSATPIDLVATSDVVTLRTGKDAVELPPFLISKLTVIASGRIEGLSYPTQFESFANMETANLQRDTNALPAMLSLSGVKLSADANLSVRRYPGSHSTFELAIADPSNKPAKLTLFAQGALKINTETAHRQDTFNQTTTLRIDLREPHLTLRFTLAEREWSIQQPLSLSHLDFRDTDADGRLSSIFSSLRSGSIRFIGIDNLDGNERTLELQPREMLVVGDIRDGFVGNLALSDNQIKLNMSGYVSSLRTTWRSLSRDHMPTLFATLASVDYFKAICGLAIGLFWALAQILPLRGAKE